MTVPPSVSGALDAEAALDTIDRVIVAAVGTPATLTSALANLTTGKLYELYVLARLLQQLARRGWTPFFSGGTIVLKASPGAIQPGDAHFEIHHSGGTVAEIYTDIQVTTLGSTLAQVSDYSAYHEIDIVVVPAGTSGMPTPDELLLGIECKALANFRKSVVREVLGRRRELSFVIRGTEPCLLDASEQVPANPPSEYWLTYIDPAGDNYRDSPRAFGIEFKHWQP